MSEWRVGLLVLGAFAVVGWSLGALIAASRVLPEFVVMP